jgi:hypothetical protein
LACEKVDFSNLTVTYNFYFFEEQVDKPKIGYNGQKLIKLVSAKTAASIIRTKPSVPLTTLVK